jgi:hypothetical protein
MVRDKQELNARERKTKARNKNRTYNQSSLLHVPGKLCVFREEAVARMDHVDIVLEGNFDDLVTGQVSSNGRVLSTLANDIGFVGLLPVHAESVFITEYGDGVQGKLVGSTEDSDLGRVSFCKPALGSE